MKIGYCRVSTLDQSLDLQLDALKKAGCEKVFSDKMSGGRFDRPGLEDAIKFARSGDTIVVYKLDRLGRSIKHLITTVNELNRNGIGFESLGESIDTTNPGGKLIFHIFGALAEFEKDLIGARTRAGLLAARERGRIGGRPKKLSINEKEEVRKLFTSRIQSPKAICKRYGISKATLYRVLKEAPS